MDGTAQDITALPGDGYVRFEFHLVMVVFIAMALRRLRQPVYTYLHIPMYLLSMILVIYGIIEQKHILSKNTWLYHLDYHPLIISSAEKQAAHQFIHFSLVTWLASLLLDTRVLQFIHCDIVSNVRNIDYTVSFRKALAMTAILVVTVMTSMELTIMCQVSGDWNVLGYMMLTMGFKLLQTLCQGHMFVYGKIITAQTYTQRLSFLMTCVANIVIPVANALTIHIYWTPVYVSYVLAPLLIFDVFYRIALLCWYIKGVAPEHNEQIIDQVENNQNRAVEEWVPRNNEPVDPDENNPNGVYNLPPADAEVAHKARYHNVGEDNKFAVQEANEFEGATQCYESTIYFTNENGLISSNVIVEGLPTP